ncbi:unnamed protein product [Tenebrio molitor]|nr:unnamed protein product [Tenebrio molitor]
MVKELSEQGEWSFSGRKSSTRKNPGVWCHAPSGIPTVRVAPSAKKLKRDTPSRGRGELM